jgi:hypothetical protein
MVLKDLREKEYIVVTASDAVSMSLGVTPAYFVCRHRLNNNIWGFNLRTRCKRYISQGTKLIFYISGKRNFGNTFIAEAEVADFSYPFPRRDLSRYMDENKWYCDNPSYKIELENIRWFNKPVNIYDMKEKMEYFLSKKKIRNWGFYIQGGAFRISHNDYEIIREYSV